MSNNWKQKVKYFFIRTYHPKPTVDGTIKLFIGFGFFFLFIGIMFSVMNASIKTHRQRYDDVCKELNKVCELTIELKEEIKQPVYFLYGLTNFYQNHRRYIKSKSYSQLAGFELKMEEAKQFCSPVITNKEMGKTKSVDGSTLNETDIASPCGLVAYSYFTDTFKLYKDNVEVQMTKSGITWPSDKGYKFKNGPNWKQKQWIDMEKEDFIIWMKSSGLPEFDKIYGKIQQNLPAGQYKLNISNNYDQNMFGGEKSIYITNSGPFGGKNKFLEISYYLFGAICFVISLIFYVKKKMTKEGEFGSIKQD